MNPPSWTPDRILAVAGGLGLILFLYFFFFGRRRAAAAIAGTGSQTAQIVVSGGYRPNLIVAKKGVPLTLVFDRRESSPCSDEIVLPEFKIRRSLPAHARTEIVLLPTRTGEFPFSCGMNMLHGKIRIQD